VRERLCGEAFPEKAKNLRPVSDAGPSPSVVCSTPMQVRYRIVIARWFQEY
jgi:hypothetical protein